MAAAPTPHRATLFRPPIQLIRDGVVRPPGAPTLVNTREADARADYTWAVVEAADPALAGIGPLQDM
jgi:hypothetical protein